MVAVAFAFLGFVDTNPPAQETAGFIPGSGETPRFLCREAKSKANSEALALSEQRLSQALQQASEARWGQCDSAGSSRKNIPRNNEDHVVEWWVLYSERCFLGRSVDFLIEWGIKRKNIHIYFFWTCEQETLRIGIVVKWLLKSEPKANLAVASQRNILITSKNSQ